MYTIFYNVESFLQNNSYFLNLHNKDKHKTQI